MARQRWHNLHLDRKALEAWAVMDFIGRLCKFSGAEYNFEHPQYACGGRMPAALPVAVSLPCQQEAKFSKRCASTSTTTAGLVPVSK